MTLAERIAAELNRVSTDRYMFGLFGDDRMGSGGFGKLQILGKTKHVTRCQNCGRAGLKHAVVCAVVGEDGHPTNQYYYFGTDCAAKLAGKAEKDVEAEADHQESSGRPRMKSLKPAKPNEGQMELGLRFSAFWQGLSTERYAKKASKGQMGFDFDAMASAPQSPAPVTEPAMPMATERQPMATAKGRQMGLFEQPEQPPMATKPATKPTGWEEEKHPRWEAGDKQHHGGQFSPKESKTESKKPAVSDKVVPLKEAVERGIPFSEWQHEVSKAFTGEHINEDHPAWQSLVNAPPRAHELFSGQSLVGKKVTGYDGHNNRYYGVVTKATVSGNGQAAVHVTGSDGRELLMNPATIDDLSAYVSHRQKQGKQVDPAAMQFLNEATGQPVQEAPKTQYFKGDQIRLTGKTDGDFEEFEYLEGHKKGQAGLRLSPAASAAQVEQKKQEWKDQQAQFARLHQKQEDPKAAELAAPSQPAIQFSGVRDAADELQSIRNELASVNPDREAIKKRVDAVGGWIGGQKTNSPSLLKLAQEAHQLADKLDGGSGKGGNQISVQPEVAKPQAAGKLVAGDRVTWKDDTPGSDGKYREKHGTIVGPPKSRAPYYDHRVRFDDGTEDDYGADELKPGPGVKAEQVNKVPPHLMATNDLISAVKAQDPSKEFLEATTEDWGSLRGQGKRAGGMVMGGMRDSSLQGKKTYVDPTGKLPPEQKEDVNALASDNPPAKLDYLRGRGFGLSHDDALDLAYEMHGHLPSGEAQRRMAGRIGQQELSSPASSSEIQGEANEPVATATTESSPIGQQVAAAIAKRSMDFGRKVEVRKDRAKKLGPRENANADAESAEQVEGWARRYKIVRIDKSRDKSEEGKYAIYDARTKSRYAGIGHKQATRRLFESEAEAKAALPLLEVARNHDVAQSRDGKTYEIRRRFDRHAATVKGGFASREEASRYMAMNPREIINHKFPSYETYQYLDRVERQGPERRKGQVNEQDFQRAFVPGGAVFGNWMTNKDGVTAFHHAYDSLHDLADALEIDPQQVSLDGDLVYGFGAAGSGGKNAARAHYEPGQRLINLTKMAGAGSLAHEWWHALDHFMAKHHQLSDHTAIGSHSYQMKGDAGLKKAIQELEHALHNTSEDRVIEAHDKAQDERDEKRRAHRDEWRQKSIANKTEIPYAESVSDHLHNLRVRRDSLIGWKKKNPTPELLKQYDELEQKIAIGEHGDEVHVPGKGQWSIGTRTFSNIKALDDVHKKITGRSFLAGDSNSYSPGKELYTQIRVDKALAQEKAERAAKAGQTERVSRSSTFSREAAELDRTRASRYYTLPEEMGARAFEAYIADKLNEKGIRSDYLIGKGKTDNAIYRAVGLPGPFPEGEERKQINAAFDKLLNEVRKHLRKPETERHALADEARELSQRVQRIVERYSAAPGFEELLARAAKYRVKGQGYNRNIHTSASRLDDMLSQGRHKEAAHWADELRLRLDALEPKPATDLLGQPVKPAPKPKAVFDSSKGKQQTLFAGLNAKEGQMNLFADAGVPDDLVAKPQKPAQKELFSAVREALVERYAAQQSPWFLRSARVLAEKMGQHAPASQVLATLRNNQVSPEELKWTGLEKHLLGKGNQPVSQQELHDLIGQFNVGEKVLGDRGYSDKLRKFIAETGWRQDIDGPLHDYIYKMGTEAHKAKLHDKAEEFLQLGNEAWEKRYADNEPKYASYALPGGQNYREMLLTLPQQEKGIEWWYQNVHRPVAVSDMGGDQSLVPDSFEGYDANAKDDLQEMYQDWQKKQGNASQSGYLSNHWDEPNVLAHVRYQDFTGPDGKKHLHIDEIQSDWHQQGRKQGYSSNREERDDAAEQIRDLLDQQQQHHPGSKQWNAINEQIIPLGVVANGGGPDSVPNAPFKNNWHMLAMKRMMHHAAANGYDRVTWTPGEEHASRYDLSKHIDSIHHVPESGELHVLDKDDNFLINGHIRDGKIHQPKNQFHGKALEEVFGKDLAERISKGHPSPITGAVSISGQGLKLGGEGMKGFYDRMLPNDTNKLIKKHGGKVGQFDLHLPEHGDSGGFEVKPPRSIKVHGFDVTPSMKSEAAAGKGQSMFSVYEDSDWRIERYEQTGDRQPKFRIDAGMKAAAQQTPPSTKPPAIFGAIGGLASKAGNWLQDKADKVAGKIGGAAQKLDQKGQAAMAKVGLAEKPVAQAKPKSAGVKAGAPLMFNGDHAINGGQTSIPKGTQGKLVGPHQDPKNVVVDVGGQHHVVPKSLLLYDLRHTDHKAVEKSKQEAQQAQAEQQAKVRQMTARQRAEAVPDGADKAKLKSMNLGSHELQAGDIVNHGTPGLHPYGRVLEVSPDGKKIKIEEATRSKKSPGGIATTGRHVWIDGHEKIGDTGAIGTRSFPVLRTPDEYRPIGERKEYKEGFDAAKKLGLGDDQAHEMAMQMWDDLQAKNNPKPQQAQNAQPAAQAQPEAAQPQAASPKPRHHAESLQSGDTLRMLKGTDTGTNLKFVGRGKQPGMVEVEHPTLGRQTFRSRDLGLYVPGSPKAAAPSFTDQMKKGYDRSAPELHTVKRSEFAGQKHGVLAKDQQGRGFLLYGGKKFALNQNEFDGQKLIGDNPGVKIRERIHREQVQSLASKNPSAVPAHVQEEYDHHWNKWTGDSAFAKSGGKPAEGPAQLPQDEPVSKPVAKASPAGKRGPTLKGMPLNTPVGSAGVGRLTPVEQRSPLEDPEMREQVAERAAIMQEGGGYDPQTALRLAIRDAARRFVPKVPLPEPSRQPSPEAKRPDSRAAAGQRADNPARLRAQQAALNRSLQEDADAAQQPKAIFLGRDRFRNAIQAAPSRIRGGSSSAPVQPAAIQPPDAAPAPDPIDEEAEERAAIQAEINEQPAGGTASPPPTQPERAATAPPADNPPEAKPQSANLRALIRPFQAGQNLASMQFDSQQQRDLYDYAAGLGRARQNPGRASGKQPKKAAELESALNRIAAEHFGGDKDAAHLAAIQTLAHVKSHMKGVPNGQHKVIPPLGVAPDEKLGKLPTNPTAGQAEQHVNTMVNRHIREFAARENQVVDKLKNAWKMYREKMGLPGDRRFKSSKELQEKMAQGGDFAGSGLKGFDMWADQIFKDFPWAFRDENGERDDSKIFEFIGGPPPQPILASDQSLQEKFWESVHPEYRQQLERMRMREVPLEHIELKDILPDDFRDFEGHRRQMDQYASGALVERFSVFWHQNGGLHGRKAGQQRSISTTYRG